MSLAPASGFQPERCPKVVAEIRVFPASTCPAWRAIRLSSLESSRMVMTVAEMQFPVPRIQSPISFHPSARWMGYTPRYSRLSCQALGFDIGIKNPTTSSANALITAHFSHRLLGKELRRRCYAQHAFLQLPLGAEERARRNWAKAKIVVLGGFLLLF